MFERFDDNARQVVREAQAVVRRLNHDYVGTEHLIVALAGLGKGVSRTVLLEKGYTPDALLEQIEEGNAEPHRDLPFTPRAKKVVEQSLREAIARKSIAITDADLLLAILHAKDGNNAVEVLKKVGGPNAATDLREATLKHLSAADLARPKVSSEPSADKEPKTSETDSSLIGQITDSLAGLPADELREVLCLVKMPPLERQEILKPLH